MMHNLTKAVDEIKQLKHIAPGTALLLENREVELSKELFKEIAQRDFGGKIAFVDGGNASLTGSAHYSLQLFRIYATIYKQIEREKNFYKECFGLIRTVQNGRSIFYKTEIFGGEKFNHLVDSFDETLRTGKHRIAPEKTGEVVRATLELGMALEVAQQLEKGDLVVLDGTLARETQAEKEQLAKLFEEAKNKEITVCAVAKANNLITNTGIGVVEVLQALGLEKEWFYDCGSKEEVTTVFAKLHQRAKQAYRIDIFNGKVEETVSALARTAEDPSFYGYPYGLIEADRFARITHREQEALKALLNSKIDLVQDTHEVLNRIV